MSTLEVFRLARLALKHWKAHQPTLYHDLERAGRLKQTAEHAATQTLSDRDSLIALGQTPQEAWETVRERYLFLRPEITPPIQNDLTDITKDLMAIYRAVESD